MIERIIMAGSGGQGLMTLGKLVATVTMQQGLHVTYFPSYGAEVRGGTANCQVVLSDQEVYSPIVERADTLILMNQPSYERFRDMLAPDGLMVLNSSMIADGATGAARPLQAVQGCSLQSGEPAQRAAIVRVRATDIANDLGDLRVGNMVMLGAYSAVRDLVPQEAVAEYLREAFGERKAALVDLNLAAFRAGREQAEISAAPTAW